MASLTVRGEFAAVTLEQHGIGGSERGSVVHRLSRSCATLLRSSSANGAARPDHQLAPAVTRQPVVMIGGHRLPGGAWPANWAEQRTGTPEPNTIR